MADLTTDPTDPRLSHGPADREPTPQADAYLVLSKEEIAKGFVEPLRTSYTHSCGRATKMSKELAETYARDPDFYGATYCVGCGMHRPVGEFKWDDGNVVGSHSKVPQVLGFASDRLFARHLADRLNFLCRDAKVREVVEQLLWLSVPVEDDTAINHPTLQCYGPNETLNGETYDHHRTTVLGVLNGLCGANANSIGHLSVVTSKDLPRKLQSKDPFLVTEEQETP